MQRSDIQKFIDEDINPALEMHGGYLSIKDFDEDKNNLRVELGGGCQGCASARATLHLQVERFLREEFPDLGEIEDVTDHASGTNPYY